MGFGPAQQQQQLPQVAVGQTGMGGDPQVVEMIEPKGNITQSQPQQEQQLAHVAVGQTGMGDVPHADGIVAHAHPYQQQQVARVTERASTTGQSTRVR